MKNFLSVTQIFLKRCTNWSDEQYEMLNVMEEVNLSIHESTELMKKYSTCPSCGSDNVFGESTKGDATFIFSCKCGWKVLVLRKNNSGKNQFLTLISFLLFTTLFCGFIFLLRRFIGE
jgi:hypothetical protein